MKNLKELIYGQLGELILEEMETMSNFCKENRIELESNGTIFKNGQEISNEKFEELYENSIQRG